MKHKLPHIWKFFSSHPRRIELYIALILLVIIPLTLSISQINQTLLQYAQAPTSASNSNFTFHCLSLQPCAPINQQIAVAPNAATNGTPNSNITPSPSASPSAAGAPKWAYLAPTNLRVGPVTQTSLTVTWNGVTGSKPTIPGGVPVPGSYTVAVYNTKGTLIAQNVVGDLTDTVTGLPSGSVVIVHVWANDGPLAPPGGVVEVQLGTAANPTFGGAIQWAYLAPANIKASNIVATGMTLSWNAVTGTTPVITGGVNPPTSYTIAYYTTAGTLITEATSTTTFYTNTKALPAGSTVIAHVWANGGPMAPAGAVIEVKLGVAGGATGTPGGATGTPNANGSTVQWAYLAPTNPKDSGITATSVALSWTAVTGSTPTITGGVPPPSSYTVAAYNTSGALVKEATPTGTSYTMTGLPSGSTVTIHIWANGGPKAPTGASLTVKLTGAAPAAPASGASGCSTPAGAISSVQVTGYNTTGASFSWAAATGATQGYAWKLTVVSGTGTPQSGNTTATHVSVNGLSAGVYNLGVQGLPCGPGNNVHTPQIKG